MGQGGGRRDVVRHVGTDYTGMSDEIETKLSAARTRLILDKPFLGALVLRLPRKGRKPERCTTIGTDVRALYYNPEYIS